MVEGTRADGLDVVLERDADRDLAPGAELARTERRLAILVGGVVGLTLLLLAGAWATGALGTAAREAPGWLAFGLTLVGASVAFGAIALMGPKTRGQRERHLHGAQLLLQPHAAAADRDGGHARARGPRLRRRDRSPVLAVERAHPAAAVSFEATARGVEATVELSAAGLASGTEVRVVMRSFDTAASEGDVVGTVTATSDPEGIVEVRDEIALSGLASYLAVQVQIADQLIGACSPMSVTEPGCTVVAVPRSLAEDGSAQATTVVVPVTTLPSAAPSPATSIVTPTPSPTTTTTTTVAPTSPAP